MSSAHLSMSDSLNLTCYRWESVITGFWSFNSGYGADKYLSRIAWLHSVLQPQGCIWYGDVRLDLARQPSKFEA
jgi:hypothetical protein